jgi:hypothetical protein
MGDAHFVSETIQALNSHAAELDSMYRGIMVAVENRTKIPNVKDIFKEMAEASRECDEMLEIYYGDGDPLLLDARRVIEKSSDRTVEMNKRRRLSSASGRNCRRY